MAGDLANFSSESRWGKQSILVVIIWDIWNFREFMFDFLTWEMRALWFKKSKFAYAN